MPGKYTGLGIEFMYPESWSVDADVTGDSVSVESPEGAFLTITRCAGAGAAQVALEKASEAMQEEYDEVESEAIAKQLAQTTLTGQVLRFVVLDLIVTSQLLVLPTAAGGFLIQTQAEDRDHDRLLPVFDAILTSLCQQLTVSN